MRNRTVAAFALVLALTPMGCSGVAPSRSVAPSADPALAFARCMRDQGLSWYPDPEADGRTRVQVPDGVPNETVDAAHEACKQYMPDGGKAPEPSAEDLEKVRQMAKCMRENGVPNFPDPEPNGRLSIDGDKLGTGPGDPTWDRAEKACAQHMPEGHTEKRAGKPGGAG